MEALAISLLIGMGLLLGGASWKGMARWVLGALGLAALIVSLSRLCELYPNSCSLNCWIGQLSGQACATPPDPNPPSPSPTPSDLISPSLPSVPPSLPVSPGQVSPSALPSFPPVQPALPPPTAVSPLQSPAAPVQKPAQPIPTPRPSASPCADGNCDCVNYKCLW